MMPVVTRAMARTTKEPLPDSNMGVSKLSDQAQSDSGDELSEEWKYVSRSKREGTKIEEKPLSQVIEDVLSFLKLENDEKRSFFINRVSQTHCSRCGAKGKWFRGSKDPKTRSWRWGCGTLMDTEGCARVITQVQLFAAAFGVTDFREFKSRLPAGTYKNIKNLDLCPTINSSRVGKRLPHNRDENNGETMKDAAKKPLTVEASESLPDHVKAWASSLKSLIASAINLAKLATTLEESKAAYSILEQANVLLENAEAVKELEKSRTVNPKVYSPAKPLSYSAMVMKGFPPIHRKVIPERMNGVQIENTSSDPNQRMKLACQALAWRKKAPIGQRMLKGDVQLEEGPLKKNVESIEFVYVEGISKMKYGLARGILRSAGVKMQAIRDISFVGSRVCSFLVDRDYKEKLVKILTSEGSPLKVIPNFDPLSQDHLKKPVTSGKVNQPVDYYIRRAAVAVANNNRLEVATKYQAQLPAEHREKLRLEVQRIAAKRGKPKGILKVTTAVPDAPSGQGAMDTDP